MNDNNKKTFKELWNNKRTHALIVLGIWFAIFAFLFLVLGVASLFQSTKTLPIKEEETPKIVQPNIPKMLENLISSNYTFEYQITKQVIQEEIETVQHYSYTGTVENGITTGYYESSTGIIKYTIEDGVYYQINNEEKIENNDIISLEDRNILDLNSLLTKIKEYTSTYNEEENNYHYEITEETINYEIQIATEGSNIKTIIIKSDLAEYNLQFKNIVFIEE